MANEISISAVASLANGNLEDSANAEATLDQSAIGRHKASHNIGTSEEAQSFPELTTPGQILMKNLSDDYTVSYGTVTTDLGFQLGPKEVALLYLKSGETLRMQATGGAAEVDIFALEA
jgi:hypothetical protein